MSDIKNIIDKIKSAGYWYINFYPLKPIENRIPSRTECKRLIEETRVNLRGWDYPHFPIRQDSNSQIYFGPDYVEASVDWWAQKEAWRYYQSGQFIHYLGINEDWFVDNKWAEDYLKNIKPGTVLSVINTIYTVTEIFEFIRRLTERGLYDDGLNINIILFGISDRKLVIFDPNRVPLGDDYKAHVNQLPWFKQISKNEMLIKSEEISFSLICFIFETFNWERIPKAVIKEDQRKFLQRREV
ncbi:MAG TPA: hypothetical protein ENI34_08570 [candidate division WOR-3 bacterium]|uniref:Uncharacterized protein n=1 Tax=candidate division WOR-3 bacterium TaxID=2052148 RepID=A0A9C9EPL6_UNCW3|nr:hypothetical protein [candidate division WOR-3 bacterium]